MTRTELDDLIEKEVVKALRDIADKITSNDVKEDRNMYAAVIAQSSSATLQASISAIISILESAGVLRLDP